MCRGDPRFAVPKIARRMRKRLGALGREHTPFVYAAFKSLRDKLHARDA